MSTNDVGPGPTVDKIEAAWDAIAQAWSRARAHQLERPGLVERSPDATDGRTVRLRLTWVGEGVLARVLTARRAQLAEILWGWEEADRERFALLLHRFAADIVATSETPR